MSNRKRRIEKEYQPEDINWGYQPEEIKRGYQPVDQPSPNCARVGGYTPTGCGGSNSSGPKPPDEE